MSIFFVYILLVLINNSIIDSDSNKALKDKAKISELEAYLSMYDNLEIENVYQESIDKLKDDRLKDQQQPFKDLNLENLEIDKLKLNLTK